MVLENSIRKVPETLSLFKLLESINKRELFKEKNETELKWHQESVGGRQATGQGSLEHRVTD